jgi:serine/threonine protein kinase
MDCGNLVGQTLDRRYQIKAKLGDGGMGIVYRAYDPRFELERALKVMAEKYAQAPEFKQRFQIEAQIANKLNHPGLVKVLDYNPDPPCPYLVMELIAGPNLATYLEKQSGKLALTEAVKILQEVSSAVAYLHEQTPPILHRDIKPSNILLKRKFNAPSEYQPVLTDFGLAKLTTQSDLTEVGKPYGTPGYMSPEQVRDSATVDQRSDIFALGVLLYQVTTGRLPFAKGSLIDTPPHPPSDYRPELPSRLESIILKALAPEPSQRYASAQQLAADLAAVLPEVIEIDARTGHKRVSVGPETEVISGVPAPPPAPPPPTLTSTPDRIRIQLPDGNIYTQELTTVGLTIGRSPENQLVLNFPKVSWRHARVDFDGRHYAITDLDSRNRTFLENIHLLPGQSQVWLPSQWVTIGGCFLLLERDTASIGEEAPQQHAQPGTNAISEPPIPFTAIFNPKEIELTAGQLNKITLILDNNRRITEQFILEFRLLYQKKDEEQDLEKWLKISQLTEIVLANTAKEIPLSLQPPLKAEEGTYQLTVYVTRVSDLDKRPSPTGDRDRRSNLEGKPGDTCWLKLRRATHFTSKLDQDTRRQTWRLTIVNQGNARESFRLKWSDPTEELLFYDTKTRISLKESTISLDAPGEKKGQNPTAEKEIEFRIARRRRHQFGEEEPFKFRVEVKAEHGQSREHQGEFISKASTPAWLPIAAAILILLGCLAVIGWVITQPQLQITAVSPEIPAAGQPLTVRWTAAWTVRALRLNGTPVPLELTEYTFPAGLPAGVQEVNLVGKDFSTLRTITSTWQFGVAGPTPTPVIAPPVIELFTVSPAQAIPGEKVTLKWQVINADTVQIDAFGNVPPIGEQADQPQQTTRYTLTAANKDTAPVQKVITLLMVTPTPSPTPTLVATPVPANPGGGSGDNTSGGNNGSGSDDTASGDNASGGNETPQNANPVAMDDSKNTTTGNSTDINVLGNDTDPDGDALTINSIVTSDQTNGTVDFRDLVTLRYSPAPGFSGTAEFSYIVVDGKGGQASAKVTITVLPASTPAPTP